MKIVTTQQIRELDRLTIEKYKIAGSTLMERAGQGVADAVIRMCREQNLCKNVMLIAGQGNNGGDAFAAARILKEEGFSVKVLLAGVIAELKGDALEHFKKMSKNQISVCELVREKEWESIAAEQRNPAVVVDGILGTGLSGAPHTASACAICYVNSFGGKSRIVAIDIPSGLNSDTGLAEGDVVRADLTMTMGLPKIGLVQQIALDYVGTLEVVDLGFPSELVAEIKSDCELITSSDIKPLFPRRKRVSNKGDYGHVLIIGGAAGYSGAMTLAALAAARSGVGLVTVVAPKQLASVVAANVPEAMVRGAPETKEGSLDSSLWETWKERLSAFTAIVAGPGMTRHAQTRRLIELILNNSEIPVVLDADALNVFESEAAKLAKRKCPLVITPHPGESARLMGMTVRAVQGNRFNHAMEICRISNAVTVLKGAGTLVAEQNKPLQINSTGNAGMAKGGMGDVLSGLLGGLLAQRLSPFDAARAAVWLHGRAGDLAAARKSLQTLIACDLIAALPEAYL
jgi:NAD(P)H-hydrate epimerase